VQDCAGHSGHNLYTATSGKYHATQIPSEALASIGRWELFLVSIN
jgi:hypothetical protein